MSDGSTVSEPCDDYTFRNLKLAKRGCGTSWLVVDSSAELEALAQNTTEISWWSYWATPTCVNLTGHIKIKSPLVFGQPPKTLPFTYGLSLQGQGGAVIDASKLPSGACSKDKPSAITVSGSLSLSLEGIQVVGGVSGCSGIGVGVGGPNDQSRLWATNVIITGHRADDNPWGYTGGGGLHIYSRARVWLSECTVVGNSVIAAPYSAIGGGGIVIDKLVGGGGELCIGIRSARETRVIGNNATKKTQTHVYGAGIYNGGRLYMRMVVIEGNLIIDESEPTAVTATAANLYTDQATGLSVMSLKNKIKQDEFPGLPLGRYVSGASMCTDVTQCDRYSVGGYVHVYAAGIDDHSDEIPPKCGRGFYGNSSRHEEQWSPLCSGACPGGRLCDEDGTVDPQVTPAGYFTLEGAIQREECGSKSVYCPAGSKAPTPCPPHVQTVGGDPDGRTRTSTAPCPSGSFCTAGISFGCPMGFYCKGGERVGCPAGRRGDQFNLSNPGCAGPCKASYYCPAASPSPQSCPPGTYGEGEGLESAHNCTDCTAGSWCHSGSIYPCPTDTYTTPLGVANRSNMNICHRCPEHTLIPPEVSQSQRSSAAACACDRGFYHLEDPSNCTEAPPHLQAAQFGTDGAHLHADQGYWRPDGSSRVAKRCPYPLVCAGGLSNPTYSPTAIAGCVGGTSGVYCTMCPRANQYFDAVAATCRSCPPMKTIQQWVAFGGVSVVAVVATAALLLHRCVSIRTRNSAVRRFRRASIMTKLKLCWYFYSINVQIHAAYRVHFEPGPYRTLVDRVLVFIRLETGSLPGIAQISCLGMDKLITRLSLIALTPIGFAIAWSLARVVWLLVHHAHFLLSTLAPGCFEARRDPPRWTLLPALPLILKVFFVFFPAASSTAFQALAIGGCDCFPAFGANATQQCFLPADFSYGCDQAHGVTDPTLRARAALVACGYGIGVPLLFISLLLCARRAILGKDTRRSELKDTISFLHEEYHPHAFLWSFAEAVRVIVLTGVFALVSPGTHTQLFYALAFAILFHLFEAHVQPYREPVNRFLSHLASCCIITVLLLSLGVKIGTPQRPTELVLCVAVRSPHSNRRPHLARAACVLLIKSDPPTHHIRPARPTMRADHGTRDVCSARG